MPGFRNRPEEEAHGRRAREKFRNLVDVEDYVYDYEAEQAKMQESKPLETEKVELEKLEEVEVVNDSIIKANRRYRKIKADFRLCIYLTLCLIVGNNKTSRIEELPVRSITSRSMPMPTLRPEAFVFKCFNEVDVHLVGFLVSEGLFFRLVESVLFDRLDH